MGRQLYVFLALSVFTILLLGRAASCQQTDPYTVVKAYPSLTFNSPIDLQMPRSGDTRLFIVEQAGKIYGFAAQASASQKDLFLDISDTVSQSGGELGLLGLAFHPNYRRNGYFYVYYTTGSSPIRSVVARYRRSSTDKTVADPASGVEILTFDQPYENHNGGQIAFGPDGFLYIATGDGGSGGDPQGNGQSLATLLGKILRIDVDHRSGDSKYRIPRSNPFRRTAGAKGEIFAYGLRNPWRFSFDSRTGLLWAGDVGQDAREEIDIVRKGKNYGWNIREGSTCYSESQGCDSSGKVEPIFDYTHADGESVTGGFVYRGRRLGELRGQYVYGDFISGRIWGLRRRAGRVVNTLLADTSLNISAFGRTRRGELLLLSYSDGAIYKLQKQ